MAKLRTLFFCTECGNETPRWQGQCPACSAWNTLVDAPAPSKRAASSSGSALRTASGFRSASTSASAADPVLLSNVKGTVGGDRWASGLGEFDFVLGGGVVPGSLVLIGGEPGIGKSTLLLQVAARLQASGRSALYVSGEESAAQTRLRAERLAEPAGDVRFLAETRLESVFEHTAALSPAVVFIDSIQTVYTDDVEGTPGNVGQVRECAARLQRYAKESGAAVFLVGHVTKGGMVAGPKTLEHIVDTVLYFEGTGSLDHRVLRATKNRFGGVDEIGVFRMGARGLDPVENPSALFLGERAQQASGAAVAATLEGTRPLLVEIQALCTKASYGAPQRVANGIDRQRLALLLAVLEKRAGLPFGQLDVFVNVVGGVRINETASDLAVVAALASSVADRPLPHDAVFLGEVGLSGELRAVGQLERRLAEASRMGFTRAYVPERAAGLRSAGITLIGLRDIDALLSRAIR